MTIYEELIQRVSNGETFDINFNTKSLRVGKNYLVKNGKYNVDDLPWQAANIDDVIDSIHILYYQYKFSLPSERSECARRKYFKALSIHEIPDDKLFCAERRELAQAKLEAYILLSVLCGNLTWNDAWGSWFYQSKNDPDLVILRSWVDNN